MRLIVSETLICRVACQLELLCIHQYFKSYIHQRYLRTEEDMVCSSLIEQFYIEQDNLQFHCLSNLDINSTTCKNGT